MTEPFLMRMAHGAPIRFSNKSRDSTRGLHNKRQNQHEISNRAANSDDQTLRVCRRFYVALILSLLVQVLSLSHVLKYLDFLLINKFLVLRVLGLTHPYKTDL